MDPIVLEAKRRSVLGKATERLRHQELIPAVLYGHHVQPLSLTVSERDFSRTFRLAGESTLVDLRVDDQQPVKVLIHDIQDHPLSGKPIHVDFYQVRMDEKITADIALRYAGEGAAVKELGGVLVKNINHIKVQCLPADLLPEIVVDTSSLATFDDVVRVSDLAIPKTIEVMEKEDSVVATVIPPRSEEELKALEEKPEENVESIEKVEKKQKEEEVEGEGEAGAAGTVEGKAEEKKKNVS